MTETNYNQLESPKSDTDRTIMHVLYGMHTVAWASMGTLAVIAVIINYIKRSDEHDAFYVAHHTYMIATFWWTMLWLAVTGLPALTIILIPLTWICWTVIGLWYLYRCIRGWLRFNDNRPPKDL